MELKKKGYKIFLQPVSVTTYSDDEMRELIKIVNKVGPHGIYIVDTYGLMHKKEMLHYFRIMDENLQRIFISDIMLIIISSLLTPIAPN